MHYILIKGLILEEDKIQKYTDLVAETIGFDGL
jgi:hypothetical protein